MGDNVLYLSHQWRLVMARRGTTTRIKSLSLSLTGAGVGWEVDASELRAVRKLIVFLEDRRVLFNPHHLEMRREVEISIDDIRSQCTELIHSVDEKSPAASAARGIRSACRKFLDFPRLDIGGGYATDNGFLVALGEFRASVGLHVAALSNEYKVEIEAELRTILPPGEEEN